MLEENYCEEQFKKIQEICSSRGGRCLSDKYYDGKTKLNFKCAIEAHTDWWALPGNILKGHWCKKCSSINTKKEAEAKFLKAITDREGKLEENYKYETGIIPVSITCVMGHTWRARPSSIIQGTWCPECCRGLSERICRIYFETLFNQKFPNKRPDWLISQSGFKLELDGYCEELNLAFEYQGPQHYENIKKFQCSLEEIQEHDLLKIELCEKQSINLIVIPTFDKFLKRSKIKEYIINECLKKNILIPNVNAEVNISAAYLPFELLKQQEIEKIAFEKNGEILSLYIGADENIVCKCNIHDYIWKALPATITRDHWCPKCAEVDRKNLDWCLKLAATHNGECKSKEFINTHTKMLWKCKIPEHQIWSATANTIQQGKWCPECAKIDKGKATKDRYQKIAPQKLEELKQMVALEGITCKSTEYLGDKVKLLWNCPIHGDWWTTPGAIKIGRRCPTCGTESATKKRKGMKFDEEFKKKQLDEIKTLVSNDNITILSTEYINDRTKLKILCSIHGEFECLPNQLKRGDRCPKCGIQKSAEARKIKFNIEKTSKELRKSKHIKLS